MTRLSHAALVEEVAAKIATHDMFDEREIARAILSLIAARLSDVTPEMVEAWNKRPLVSKLWDTKTIATADWRAMLAASPLVEGGK